MKLSIYLIAICIFSITSCYAQIAINDDGETAAISAMLDVQSTNKGMLVPRMTSDQRTNINAPVLGLLVFDTNTKSFWFYTDNWQELTTGASGIMEDVNGKLIISTGVGIGAEEVTAKLHVVGSDGDESILKIESPEEYDNSVSVGPIGLNARCVVDGLITERGIAGSFEGGLLGVTATGRASFGLFASSNAAAGVYGQSLSSYGVQGTAANETAGVYGQGVNASAGVKGKSVSVGVLGESDSSWGVAGYSTGDPSIGAGLYGRATDGVGVFGRTDNDASYAGYFAGDVYTSGSYLPSDGTLKQNEQLIQNAISVLNQLQPKSYNYRTNEFQDLNLPDGTRYGLVAQEVENVLPQLVKQASMNVYDWEGFDRETTRLVSAEKPTPNMPKVEETIQFKAVNYTEFIPILIAGVQEQQTNIQNLTNTNVALQSEVNSLKNELQNLKQAIQQLSEQDNR